MAGVSTVDCRRISRATLGVARDARGAGRRCRVGAAIEHGNGLTVATSLVRDGSASEVFDCDNQPDPVTDLLNAHFLQHILVALDQVVPVDMISWRQISDQIRAESSEQSHPTLEYVRILATVDTP